NCYAVVTTFINNGGVANASSLGWHTLESDVAGFSALLPLTIEAQMAKKKTKGKKLMEVEKQTTTSDVKMHDVDSITQQAKGISAIAVKSEYSLRSASNGSDVKVTSKSKPPKCRQMPKGMNVDVATEHK
ncbi:hypothetical protein Tco_0166193, partial [Tanacetum coccineum]